MAMDVDLGAGRITLTATKHLTGKTLQDFGASCDITKSVTDVSEGTATSDSARGAQRAAAAAADQRLAAAAPRVEQAGTGDPAGAEMLNTSNVLLLMDKIYTERRERAQNADELPAELQRFFPLNWGKAFWAVVDAASRHYIKRRLHYKKSVILADKLVYLARLRLLRDMVAQWSDADETWLWEAAAQVLLSVHGEQPNEL